MRHSASMSQWHRNHWFFWIGLLVMHLQAKNWAEIIPSYISLSINVCPISLSQLVHHELPSNQNMTMIGHNIPHNLILTTATFLWTLQIHPNDIFPITDTAEYLKCPRTFRVLIGGNDNNNAGAWSCFWLIWLKGECWESVTAKNLQKYKPELHCHVIHHALITYLILLFYIFRIFVTMLINKISMRDCLKHNFIV